MYSEDSIPCRASVLWQVRWCPWLDSNLWWPYCLQGTKPNAAWKSSNLEGAKLCQWSESEKRQVMERYLLAYMGTSYSPSMLQVRKLAFRSQLWCIQIWIQTHKLTMCGTGARCNVNFPAAEWRHCSYHSESPIISNGSRVGKYPCCGQPAHRQRTESTPNSGYLGCLSREHQASIGEKIFHRQCMQNILPKEHLLHHWWQPSLESKADCEFYTLLGKAW